MPTGILSGGQYDKLLQKMGRTSRAIGFAIYLDRLERLGHTSGRFDVDAVLLHDQDIDVIQLLAASEELRKNGSVLVCAQLPLNCTYRCLYEMKNGEAVLLEDNG